MAQINQMWSDCASPCVIDAAQPLGKGWWYHADRRCYLPWQLGSSMVRVMARVRVRVRVS